MKLRQYSAILMALVMAASLIGCGGSAAPAEGSSKAESTQAAGSGAKIPGGDETSASAASEAPAAPAAAESSEAAESSGESESSEAAAAPAESKAEDQSEAAKESAGADKEQAENAADSKGEKDGADAVAGKNSGKTKKAAPEPLQLIIHTHSEDHFDEELFQIDSTIQWTTIELPEEEAEKYPKLAKGLEDWNEIEEQASIYNFAELKDAFAQFKVDRSDIAYDMYFESTINSKALRADSAVVSVYHDFYSYEGGAHGYYGYTGTNFDTQTGKELLLTDVVKDMDTFLDLVDEKIQADYEEIYEYLSNPKEEILFRLGDAPEMVNWSIDNEGVAVYFNPYVIGGFAHGAQMAKICFSEHPEIFEKKYTAVPDSYFIPFIDDQKMEIDTDGDGTREVLTIEAVDNQYDYITWEVSDGRNSIRIDDSAYTEESYVVRANDQYYLYMIEVADNAYSALTVIDLKTMERKDEDWISASLAVSAEEWDTDGDEYSYGEYALTDTSDFKFSQYLYFLGSRSGDMSFKVGEDGYPEATGPWYSIHSIDVLQAMQDIKCEIVDENGRVLKIEDQSAGRKQAIGKNIPGKKPGQGQNSRGTALETGVLKEGTYVFPIRTDGNSWMDFQEIDASLVEDNGEEEYAYLSASTLPEADYSKPVYRIYVDISDYPATINGVPEDVAFRGILYAG